MTEHYFVSKDGKYHVSENFTVKEFACKDKSDVVWIDDDLVAVLQMIREHYSKPVIINSAYRTPEWNGKVGGAKYSYHQLGMAADIRIKDVSSKDLAKTASNLMKMGGVICYTNFVHVDVRTIERYRKGVD